MATRQKSDGEVGKGCKVDAAGGGRDRGPFVIVCAASGGFYDRGNLDLFVMKEIIYRLFLFCSHIA